jgi:tRNA(Ile)-lysidine synthase
VALTDVLVRLAPREGFRLVAAHLDHGLRPDSGEDAAFCGERCRDWGIPLRTDRADVRGRARRDHAGLEDAARRERYAFLRRVKDGEGARWIAVAHTRDDQAETLLLRLLRGSGRAGLSAMRPRQGDLVRPLLGVSRDAVRRHLRSRGLSWREDPTNADLTFARNRVRNELLPLLEARFNPKLRATLARTASLLADESALLEDLADGLWSRAGRFVEGVAVLRRAELTRAPRALARLVVRRALAAGGGRAGAEHVERLLDLASREGSSGRNLPLPGGREAQVVFDELRIGPRPPALAAPFALPLHVPGQVELPDGRVVVAESAAGPAVSNGETAVVAAPEDGSTLVVRTRRPGDRVRFHGREVSLKRYLMERRVAASERAGLPLVAAGSEVLFVPGGASESGTADEGKSQSLGSEVSGAALAGPPGPRYVKLSLVEGHSS